MGWNLDDLNPPAKFWYVDNGKKTGDWVSLCLASDEDNKRFFDLVGVKEKVEYRKDPQTRQMQRLTYFDSTDEQRDRFNEEIWDFSIKEWNLTGKSKEDKVPCTRENKVKLMRGSPKFAQWIAECLEKMRADLQVYYEEEQKN
jgi:hypothetical protein